MRKILALAGAALFLAALAARADEPATLRFAVPGSGTTTTVWTMMWAPWLAKVEADSDGALKIEPFPGFAIATPANVYDRVAEGAADMGAGTQGSIGGKFLGSSVVELPSGIHGRDGAAAFWRIYQDGLIANDYAEVRVLSLYVYPQSIINTWKPVNDLASVKGLKLATLTKADADLAELLGAAPISMSPVDVYASLQRRGVDGVVMGWPALTVFKLQEVTSYHIAQGLGSGGGFLVINKDAYARLPPKAKEALDKNSGYAASRDQFGAALDRVYKDGEDKVAAMKGQTTVTPSSLERARFEETVARPAIASWEARVPNGAAIFKAYRDEAKKVAAEN